MIFGLDFWNLGDNDVNLVTIHNDGEHKQEIHQILDKAANILQITNYNFEMDLNFNESDGIMGNVYYATIIDLDSTANWELVIKKAPTGMLHRTFSQIVPSYRNEIYFYSQLYPKLISLVEKHFKTSNFCYPELSIPIPIYITPESILGNEMVVLQDLGAQHYQMRNPSDVFDENHIRSVFKA